MNRTVYPMEVGDAAESRIPKEIIEALARMGWNIFGVYEVVKEEIKKDKIHRKHKKSPQVGG